MLASIHTSKDLETTYDETKLGFLSIALRKSKEAQYYVNLADALRTKIDTLDDAHVLLEVTNLLVPLCEAAGISTKARSYLTERDLREIIEDFFDEFIYPLGEKFQDDLVSRYLLTLGDALGGRMRNIIGSMASERLTEKIVASLKLTEKPFFFLERKSKKWIHDASYSVDCLSNIKGLYWSRNGEHRTLLYDTTIPIVRKNIDLILLNQDCRKFSKSELKSCLSSVQNYELLGELKGGVDPAGADEHWKTAGTALSRIRSSFSEKNRTVRTLFIGAAIEKAMAEEMYTQVLDNTLTVCANLTKPTQVSEVCDWITGL